MIEIRGNVTVPRDMMVQHVNEHHVLEQSHHAQVMAYVNTLSN